MSWPKREAQCWYPDCRDWPTYKLTIHEPRSTKYHLFFCCESHLHILQERISRRAPLIERIDPRIHLKA